MARLIAIVDDDQAMREWLQQLLSERGYRTISCSDGRSAHRLVSQAQPDLVLLDLSLEAPAAGSMVLGLLTVDPATRQIPVLFHSPPMPLQPGQAQQLRERGYTFLAQPFSGDQIVAAVAAAITGRASRMESLPTSSTKGQRSSQDRRQTPRAEVASRR
jgi:CheY-like chemotaxis protein